MNTTLVSLDRGTLVTTSLLVAETFGKRHADVIRGIDILKTKCPVDFNERNFASVEYTDPKGERRPMYNLTRDGMTLLVMGYTGEKAIQFKLAYIDAFNKMEAMLAEQAKKRLMERMTRYLPAPEQLRPTQLISMLHESLCRYSHPGMRESFKSHAEEKKYRLAYEMFCAAVDSLMSVRRCVKSVDEITRAKND